MKALSILKQHRQEAAYTGNVSQSALALIPAQVRHRCDATFSHSQVYASSHTLDHIRVLLLYPYFINIPMYCKAVLGLILFLNLVTA